MHENVVVFLCKSSETQETLALALFIPSAQSWSGGFHHFLFFFFLPSFCAFSGWEGSWLFEIKCLPPTCTFMHISVVIISMIMISLSNILVSMHLNTLITLYFSDTLNQRNTNVYLVYHRPTHCYFCTIHYLRRVS